MTDERSEKEEDLLEHGVELGFEPLQLGRIHGLDYLLRRGRRRGRGADAVLHARWLRGRAGDGVHGQGAELLQQLLRRAQEPGAAQVPRALLLRLWPRPRRLVLLRLRYAAEMVVVVVQRQRRGVGGPVVVERQRQRRLESLPEVVVPEVPADDGRSDVETERGLAAVRRHHRGRRHVAPGPVHLHPGLLVVRLQAVEVKTLLPAAADVHLRHERRHGAGRRREVVRVRETWLIMRHVSMCSCCGREPGTTGAGEAGERDYDVRVAAGSPARPPAGRVPNCRWMDGWLDVRYTTLEMKSSAQNRKAE
jgi:hypothetical protein|uniref:Uncharacterized protein n=1 Tax=Zea mays TaxID=4577 RepID=A0A804LMM3_MAIZE